jgi:hypothetical protein
MFRPILTAGCWCLALVLAASATAQQVRIDKKPAPSGADPATVTYVWTVSFSRMNDPKNFELDLPIVTEQHALSEVDALKAWNRQMGNAGGWNLHTILLEGEPQSEVAAADDDGTVAKIKQLYDKIAELKEKLDQAHNIVEGKADERQVGDTFKEYIQEIEDVYQRAVDLKRWLVAQTRSITNKTFDQINDLIDRYNNLAIEYNEVAPAANKNIFSVVPRVTSSELAGKIVDVPPRPTPSVPKPVPSIEGKLFSGKMGERKVLAEFQGGGAVVLRDPTDRATEIGRGVWAQHRERLQLTTDNFAYVGGVTDDALAGKRFPASGGPTGDPQIWSLRPDTQPQPTVQPSPPPAQPVADNDFTGTWIPEGETTRGNYRTGAPGVVRDRIKIDGNRVVTHHDVYFGIVRCTAQFDGNRISLTHDQGWGGRKPRWSFEGRMQDGKIVGMAKYLDSNGDPRPMTFVRAPAE